MMHHCCYGDYGHIYIHLCQLALVHFGRCITILWDSSSNIFYFHNQPSDAFMTRVTPNIYSNGKDQFFALVQWSSILQWFARKKNRKHLFVDQRCTLNRTAKPFYHVWYAFQRKCDTAVLCNHTSHEHTSKTRLKMENVHKSLSFCTINVFFVYFSHT